MVAYPDMDYLGSRPSIYDGSDGRKSIFDRPAPTLRRDGEAHAPQPVSEIYYPPDPLARIAVMCGSRGRGKSAVINHIAYVTKATNRSRGIPWKVFSNIPLDYADEWSEDMPERIQMDETGWYALATVVFDELPELINSKRAMSGSSVSLEAQVRQLRKDFQDLLCTAQYPQELTGAFLRQVDFMCLPRIIKRKVRGLDGQWRWKVHAYTDFWNWNGSLTERPLFGMPWPPPLDSANKRRWDFGIEMTWDYYETNSKVANVHTEIGQEKLYEAKLRRELGSEVLKLFAGRPRIERRELVDWLRHELGADSDQVADTIHVLRLVFEERSGVAWALYPAHIEGDALSAEEKQAQLEAAMRRAA